MLSERKAANPTNFLIGQIAAAITAVLLFGFLAVLECGRRDAAQGAHPHGAEGGSAELDPNSVSRRLSWRLDQQLAEIVTVAPTVKAKGGAVDIKLEIETAPDVDVPMKTDEVVEVARRLSKRTWGLSSASWMSACVTPVDPDWVQ